MAKQGRTSEQIAEDRIEQARRSAATTLDLSGFGLTRLPDSLANLTSLQTLYLGNNRLTTLPDSLANLTALQALFLSDNQLTTLPDSLVRLTSLRELNLAGNQLTTLPDSLDRLTLLQCLDLSGNQLATLPDSLAQLTSLQTLFLHSNRLTTLPDSLAQLTLLQFLDLSGNQLATLPDSLAQLASLEELVLYANRLATLPDSLAKLTSLQTLDLSHNQLTTLPDSLAKLTALEKLLLHGNPALAIPPEVLGPIWQETSIYKRPAPPASILAYYFRTRRQPTRPLNEAKLLLVGEGKVGKTSLVNYLLRNQRCQGNEQMTLGIHIDHHAIPGKRPDERIQLNVWDFGGQEIMHATHQFFLTRRSLYLIVLDARHDERQNRLEYWLRLVQSFGGDSPVIIVVNQIDDGQLTLDRNGLKKKYAPNLKAFVETSCTTGSGIPELRELIQREIHNLEHVDTKLPLPWFTLKQALEKRQSQGDPHMSWADYLTLCRQHNVTDDADQERLAQFLHDLGIVLSFHDDRRLADTNILSPQWVTGGVYSIITNKPLAHSGGILARHQLSSILDRKLYPSDKQQFIIDMMKRFELCFEFDDASPDRWLIPGLLDKEQPAIEWPDTDIVRFEYRYAVLPGSVIWRFIVRNHRYLSKACPIYWRTGVVLEIDGAQALVIADPEDRRISISVQGPNPALRRAALTVVRYDLDRIHASIPRIDALGRVPLPDRPDIAVSYSHLLRLEARGTREFPPEGAEHDYSVSALLEGIANPEDRRNDFDRLQIERAQNVHIEHLHGNIIMPQDNRNQSVNARDITGSTINFGQISGRVSNSINCIPSKSGTRDTQQLKDLLTSLKSLIDQAHSRSLDQSTAKDALEHVEDLAIAAQTPQAPGMIEKAGKALRSLQRMTSDFVAPAVALATEFSRLLDTIKHWWQ